jgi:hypothetical protein
MRLHVRTPFPPSRRRLAAAETEFHSAKEYLAECEASPQASGGAEIMKARGRWSQAAANYSNTLRAYGQFLIDSDVNCPPPTRPLFKNKSRRDMTV